MPPETPIPGDDVPEPPEGWHNQPYGDGERLRSGRIRDDEVEYPDLPVD